MAMGKARAFLVLIVALFVISGCALTAGKKLDASLVQNIIHGKTTKKEISEMFGEPEQTIADEKSNETWTYSYMEGKSNPAAYIPIVGLFKVGEVNSVTETLTVVFNSKGVVIDHYYQKGKTKLY